jgi:hypothetical protein
VLAGEDRSLLYRLTPEQILGRWLGHHLKHRHSAHSMKSTGDLKVLPISILKHVASLLIASQNAESNGVL